jgi:lipopolysaccharide transport system permease protein
MTLPIVEISSKRRLFPDLAEAWQYRWAALALARRTVLTRYAQTLLGPIWLVIQPIVLTGVLTLVLGTFLGVSSEGAPYLVFAGSGTVLWAVFTRSLQETTNSLFSSGSILAKVFFPRILIPTAGVLAAAIDYVPSFGLLIIVISVYHLMPGLSVFALPFFLLLTLVLAYGLGLWLTVLDCYYRDVRLSLPYIMQILFFFTPVMYSPANVPSRYQAYLNLNPISTLLKGFRWSVIATLPPPTLTDVITASGISFLLLVTGLMFFARHEQILADRI